MQFWRYVKECTNGYNFLDNKYSTFIRHFSSEPEGVSNVFAKYFVSVYSCNQTGASMPNVSSRSSEYLSILSFDNAKIKLAKKTSNNNNKKRVFKLLIKTLNKLLVAADGISSFILKLGSLYLHL